MEKSLIIKDTVGPVLIGCAGWGVPTAAREPFPEEGSHLERYAAVFPGVEINTSFYRPHRPATYARWRNSVPASFRFSVKLPKAITHERRLHDVDDVLMKFIDEASALDEKLGCLLVQLPPSLRYDGPVAQQFFERLRTLVKTDIACEPRHASWFTAEAAEMLAGSGIALVTADPSPVPEAIPKRHADMFYIRLHGSPQIYHSAYTEEYLERVAGDVRGKASAGKRVWCIFDNTASGAAVPNALSLLSRLHERGEGGR